MKRNFILLLGINFINCLLFSQVSFNYSDFKKETAGLTLLADAEFCDGVLRLSKAQQGQIGACWYTAKTIDPKVDFKSQFTFRMLEYGGLGGGADGLVFILMDARLPVTVTTAGGKLGYHGIKTSLAIEFDTYYNYNWADPDNNHVSIHSNGPFANSVHHNSALETSLLPYPMKDGDPHYVTILYQKHLLQVYFDKIPDPVLSKHVDIDALLKLNNGPVWIGFTSATGNGWSNHDILGWSFAELDSKSNVMDDFSNENNLKFEVYPNPFTSFLNISYALSEPGHVELKLQKLNGQILKTIVDKIDDTDDYELKVNSSDLVPGIYYCILKTKHEIQTKKIIKL